MGVPRFKTMGPDCQCDEVECTIWTDNFSTDQIATEYDEVVPTWTVGSGVVVVANAGALLVTNATAPVDATGVHALVDIEIPQTAYEARLILAYVDSDNYWYLQIRVGSIAFYEVVAGVHTQYGFTRGIAGFAVDTPYRFCFSIAGDALKAHAVPTSGGTAIKLEYTHTSTITVASTQAGLYGDSGGSDIIYDNFSFNRHFIDNAACPQCSGSDPSGGFETACCGNVDRLVIRIQGSTIGMDGTYELLGVGGFAGIFANCSDNQATPTCCFRLEIDYRILDANVGPATADIGIWNTLTSDTARYIDFSFDGAGDCDDGASIPKFPVPDGSTATIFPP